MNTIINLIEKTYYFLWGDWIHLPLPGGTIINLPLLVLLLVPTGIFCTIRTRFLQIRMLPDMLRALLEKAETGHKGGSLSALQALIVSTATRVGMGNLVGIVAALSAGGAGALFWMWVTALLGSATAFIEATLAQLHKQPDPLYGGYRGGPAYYIRQALHSPALGGAFAIALILTYMGGFNALAAFNLTGFEEKSSLRTVCALRSDLLVRYQPGHQ